MNFRTLAYLIAILCWLSMIYVAVHTGEDAMILLVATFSLGALTLLVLDSARLIRTK
jgi:hypothetical protein